MKPRKQFKRGQGALIPPGFDAKPKRLIEKLCKLPNVLEGHIVAGFSEGEWAGPAIKIITEDQESADRILDQFGHLTRIDRVRKSDGKMDFKEYVFTVVDEIVVFVEAQ